MTGPIQLTPLQLALMEVLWQRGEATVAEVHAAVKKRRRLAPNTIATVLKRLAAQGVVAHRSEGRQFVYRALVGEKEARASMVAELSERLFGGDVARLVSHLIEEHEIRPGDLEKVRALIDSKTAKRRRER